MLTDQPRPDVAHRRAAIVTRRRVTDPKTHHAWAVEERELAGGRALFFVDDVSFVKIRRYPTNWTELPVEELLRLRDRLRPEQGT